MSRNLRGNGDNVGDDARSEVDDWNGIGTFVGNDLDAGVARFGLGEELEDASEGLVTVGSRKEKKLWDKECLCCQC